MRELPVVNENGTGYLVDGRPWPGGTFLVAMSFHAPEGLAAVRDETGAFHVDAEGLAGYDRRYLETAGFYEGLAAVRDERGWFHIRPDGSAAHDRRFRWSGNFQGGRCTVQDSHGFFHIDGQGRDAYATRFRYAGDYRYGIAVAHDATGALHIIENGEPLNGIAYLHAEPFHKGHAVVADREGTFHVDRSGRAIHPLRFRSAEPFYNGVALCRGLDGGLLRLRQNGTWTRIADALAPVTPADVRGFIAGGTRVGLFVRHSRRHPIDHADPNWGNDVLLTERGIADAEALGQVLGGASRLGLWSSPVARCRQTAEAIARGAGRESVRVEEHGHLGHPGIYFDRNCRPPELLRTDYHAFADAYLHNGLAQGMRPIPDASEELLAFLDQHTTGGDCTVFITHDFFSAVLMSYLGLKAPDRTDWCNYLEGVCVLQDEVAGRRFRRFICHTEGRTC